MYAEPKPSVSEEDLISEAAEVFDTWKDSTLPGSNPNPLTNGDQIKEVLDMHFFRPESRPIHDTKAAEVCTPRS